MLCAKCTLKNLGGGVGKCTGCGHVTYSRAFKFCGACSQARNVCAACGTPGAPVVTRLIGAVDDAAETFYDSSLVLSSGLIEEPREEPRD